MDHKLLQMLYQKYYRELYLYVYSLCRSQSFAEDILQDTFVKAILALPDGHTNMRAWLYKVARNLCLNAMKRETGYQQILEASKPRSADFEEPADMLIQQEKYRALYEALMKLSQRKREILIMQYFGGLKQKEIAVVLHLTPENVRVLAGRARRELKDYMEEDGYDLP